MDVFLDLDGTLTDNREGIVRSAQHAFAEMGEEVLPEEALLSWIGPTLQSSFLNHFGDQARADRALDLYRARYRETGLFENTVYPGVPAMMEALRGAGCRLWLATSKPHVYARRIVDHFGLGALLDGVFGAELDGTRGDKTELLTHALAETAAQSGAMLGDRRYDMIGARNTGLAAIGALWGYGSRDELSGAGAHHLAENAALIPTIIKDLET
ncbi:HAD hydrolase-like protein [Rhodobacteraceae bacterium NNCM2]|nr:HAD hydrolase-like protein [Coraliihabitans acroporae]